MNNTEIGYDNYMLYVNSIDQLIDNINDVLCSSLDTIASLQKRKVCYKKLAPWYNGQTLALKQASR